MSKYLYLYRGPATQMDTMSEEDSAAQMKAWGDWIGRLGTSLVDVGNPFGTRTGCPRRPARYQGGRSSRPRPSSGRPSPPRTWCPSESPARGRGRGTYSWVSPVTLLAERHNYRRTRIGGIDSVSVRPGRPWQTTRRPSRHGSRRRIPA